MNAVRVVMIVPETTRVVLKVQKEVSPAWPVPSSENITCHQNGFSAKIIETSTPEAVKIASSVERVNALIRAPELKLKYPAVPPTMASSTAPAMWSTVSPMKASWKTRKRPRETITAIEAWTTSSARVSITCRIRGRWPSQMFASRVFSEKPSRKASAAVTPPTTEP